MKSTSYKREGEKMSEDNELLNMAEVERRELQWLWWPYISYGNATMIFGPGGHGKSYISAAIAKAISTGEPMPGQAERRTPGKVLMLSAEDDPHVVIRPRLEDMGANLEQIFVPKSSFELTLQGIKKLKRFMRETMATLVTIDPMVSYIGGRIDMNKMNEVRSVLGELQKLAQETGTAMILFHHSRKSARGDESEDFERAAGSADFTNAVRSALMVQRSNDGERYFLKHVKSNYGPLGESIGYSFGEDPIFKWGEFYSRGGEPLGKKPRMKQARDNAWVFVETMLKDGPQTAQDVLAAAALEGFNRRTVYRAISGRIEMTYKRDENKRVVATWSLKDEKSGQVDPKAAVAAAMARLNAQNGASDD